MTREEQLTHIFKEFDRSAENFRLGSGGLSCEIRSLCDGETEITVFGRFHENEKEGAFVKVSAIRQGDLDVLSFEESTRLELRDALLPLLVFYAMALFFIAVIILVIVTARHPERFNKRLLWILHRGQLKL